MSAGRDSPSSTPTPTSSSALPLFDRSTNTWRWPTPLLTLRDRYDHVLFSEHFDCASASVIQRGDSDHLPVIAVLERTAAK